MGRMRLVLWLVPVILAAAAVAGMAMAGDPPAPGIIPLWDLELQAPAHRAHWESWSRKAAEGLAVREVHLQAAGRTWHYRLHELGYRLDQKGLAVESLARLDTSGTRGQDRAAVRPQLTFDPESFQASLGPLLAGVERAAEPATLALVEGAVQIHPGKPGQRLDPVQVQAAIRRALSGAGTAPANWSPEVGPPPPLVVGLSLSPVTPSPDAVDLAALGVQGLVAEYRTYYDPEIPRGENVARAAAALNGLLIRPGEVFSYNRTIGPVDAASGWQPAWVISGGRLVPGVGGGVCQTATTLYGAALRAGLEVLERHPHDLPVRYIEPSQDAAVAPGAQDLKLRNPGPGAIWIQAQAGEGEVVISLYGSLRPDREVRIQSEVLDQLPPPVQVVTDPTLPPGAEVVRQWGAPGLRSAAYRLTYEGGKLNSRELLSVDIYAPTPHVVARGGDE